MKKEIITVYALRTDENDMPIIQTIDIYKGRSNWGIKYFPLKKVKTRNKLYPYDTLFPDSYNRKGYLGPSSISDCYSRGYVFYNYSDALKRLELLMNKKELKMEKIVSEFASWKSRIEKLSNLK